MSMTIAAIIAFIGLFSAAAIQDGKTGKVHILLIAAPLIILGIVYSDILVAVFVPFFIVLLAVFFGVEAAIRRKILPPEFCFGLADVFALPMTLAFASGVIPIWGPIIFMVIVLAELPLIMRKKTVRFLPWLAVPSMAPVVLSFII